MHEHLSEMSQRLEDSEKEIESLRQQLQESQRGMLTDHLTGIGNRRMFDRFVANFVSRKSSLSARMFVVLIDLDRFKAINDQHGHAAGDQVIQFLATSLTSQWPGIAFARLGGDEFAAFFECDDREDVVEFASDIKSHFASQELVLGRDQETIGHLQFSIGVALLRDNDTEQSWVNRADELLYEAKRLGRNRSVVEPVRHE
ncbi:MAG: diguanylate cyclase [Planctomycetota bacterium]